MSAYPVHAIALLFDPVFYASAYPEIAAAGVDPLVHYLAFGIDENRDPNPHFDARWYLGRNPDASLVPGGAILHYLHLGIARGLAPNPGFDAPWYSSQHPEAAASPLHHHLRIGAALGWPTEPFDISTLVPAPAFADPLLPTILFVTHSLGGGISRHVDGLIGALDGRANCLVLRGTRRGVALSVPAMPHYAPVELADDRLPELMPLLAGFGVSRVHIHHAMEAGPALRTLVRALAVPFDFTVHDYFSICPQTVMLPFPGAKFCGDPGPAGCNACIAARPSHGATDILTWRAAHRWMLLEAERVICPSRDVRDRLSGHGLAARAIVVPHEPVKAGPWPMLQPKPPSAPMRIAVVGVLAPHKGLVTVLAVLGAAPDEIEFHLIGNTETPLDPEQTSRLHVTGRYAESELPDLLARLEPDLMWFPSPWPETYSYTLSAALQAGLPIAASRIGAFPERIDSRPLSWTLPADASATEWLALFATIGQSLAGSRAAIAAMRPAIADFYAADYLVRHSMASRGEGITDLRRSGRLSVIVVPERFASGTPTPCAFIRLLLPLDHPVIGEGIDVTLATPAEALTLRADILATQRHAIPDIASADAIASHCRDHAMALLFDLDDNLLDIPEDHPEAAILQPRAKIVGRMLRHADSIWVSTPGLKLALAAVRCDVLVVPNGLDERLWDLSRPGGPRLSGQEPVSILCMGTLTHDIDFDIVAAALDRLHREFGEAIRIDLIGFTNRAQLPPWIGRIAPSPNGQKSYPGFVAWITEKHFDIGIAPLADTPFNAAKSAIKVMDYAALGLAVLASDVSAYRNSLADGAAGPLVASTPEAWFDALAALVRDPTLRQKKARLTQVEWRGRHTLHAQAETRRMAWLAVKIT